jgi:dihydrodipicolinate synthase/N-acetylneuraminate lyase
MNALIEKPADLKPQTEWLETKWAWTAEEELIDHTTKSRLCAAALLPFKDQAPDWDGFYASIRWMQSAANHFGVELVVVLNAETGYIFDLDDSMYAEVLRRFRSEFPKSKFIAGVTARGSQDDTAFRAERYRPLMDIVQEHENCEVMLMTSKWLSGLAPEACRDAYYKIAEWLIRPGIVHALEPAFVPWARPFGPWLLWELAKHPKFVGGKISTLDEPHFLYWASMCRDLNLDFAAHSGDDFGIATAIKVGLPLLIGAAVSGAPLICAAKDMWLEDQSPAKKFKSGTGRFDTRVYKVFEAFQSLEDQVFRLDGNMSASAYKHSTAHVLHQLGIIASPEAHPACKDLRGQDEAVRMQEAFRRPIRVGQRLGLPPKLVAPGSPV